ncbi:MAG TPA: glycine cleavage system protein H [Pirellulales bacterium]
MSDDLIFLMGKFEARIPVDRRYFKNHMWALEETHDGRSRLRCGLAAYAVRLLQDVYFLEWSLDPDARVAAKETMGMIESSKAESEIYSPCAGTLAGFNDVVLADPAAINVDKYGTGWLFDLHPSGEPALLSPEEYVEHLAGAWEIAQRTIKKQIQ